jgi:hypothetical protein
MVVIIVIIVIVIILIDVVGRRPLTPLSSATLVAVAITHIFAVAIALTLVAVAHPRRCRLPSLPSPS